MNDEEDFDEEGSEQKISIVIGVLGTFIFMVLDLISLIPGVGDLEDIPGVIGFIVGLVTNAGPAVSTTLGMVIVIKAIPGLQDIPAWTIGWWAVWFATNHQNPATRLALKAAEEASSAEHGGVGGADGLGEEAINGAHDMRGEQEDAFRTAQPTGGDANEERGDTEATEPENGNGATGDDLTPREERAPMENVGEDIALPKEDFADSDERGGAMTSSEATGMDEEDEEENPRRVNDITPRKQGNLYVMPSKEGRNDRHDDHEERAA
jgi:hypothetical protein